MATNKLTPLVRTHPDTGEPSLFLSPLYLERIAGLHAGESAILLSHLESVIEDPNLAVRWHWTEGDIAIWDESCTVTAPLSTTTQRSGECGAARPMATSRSSTSLPR